MAAPFKCDEKVTIERNTGAKHPDSGADLDIWEVVALRYWANVQDVLPSRGESTKNGMVTSPKGARLRMRGVGAVTSEMRVILHSRGDKVMQIISGPAMLDDRVHYEFMIEGYPHG